MFIPNSVGQADKAGFVLYKHTSFTNDCLKPGRQAITTSSRPSNGPASHDKKLLIQQFNSVGI